MTNTAGRHHRGNCYHYRTVRSPAATRRSSIEFIRRRTRRFAHEETLTFVSEKSGCRDDNFRRWFVVRVRRSIGGNAWQPGFTRIRRLARSRSFSHSPCARRLEIPAKDHPMREWLRFLARIAEAASASRRIVPLTLVAIERAVAARLPPLGAANHQGTSRWHNRLAMLLSQVAHKSLPGSAVAVINHLRTLREGRQRCRKGGNLRVVPRFIWTSNPWPMTWPRLSPCL